MKIRWLQSSHYKDTTLIASFIMPIWGPSGADRTQVSPMNFASWIWSHNCSMLIMGILIPWKAVFILWGLFHMVWLWFICFPWVIANSYDHLPIIVGLSNRHSHNFMVTTIPLKYKSIMTLWHGKNPTLLALCEENYQGPMDSPHKGSMV